MYSCSSPVLEVRVVVPKCFLLLLCQAFKAVVTLASSSRFVLIHAVKDSKTGEEDGGDLAAQVDGVPGVVLGGIGLFVCPPTWVSARKIKPWISLLTLPQYRRWCLELQCSQSSQRGPRDRLSSTLVVSHPEQSLRRNEC